MESIDDVMLDAEDRMEKALEYMHHEFSGVRTGRASPSLVEHIQVPYYGTATRLLELAGIATPEPRLIVINPYDPTAIGTIEKAILAANIGVTPVSDGRVIRLSIPELSEERRKGLVKVVRRLAEESRVAVRNIRRDANDHIKALQKKGVVGEDERDAALADVQKATDEAITRIDRDLASKETEVMAV